MIYVEVDEAHFLRYKLSYPDSIEYKDSFGCIKISNTLSLRVYLIDSVRKTKDEFKFCDFVEKYSDFNRSGVFIANFMTNYFDYDKGDYLNDFSTILDFSKLSLDFDSILMHTRFPINITKGIEGYSFEHNNDLMYKGKVVMYGNSKHLFDVVGISKSGNRLIVIYYRMADLVTDSPLGDSCILYYEGVKPVRITAVPNQDKTTLDVLSEYSTKEAIDFLNDYGEE